MVYSEVSAGENFYSDVNEWGTIKRKGVYKQNSLDRAPKIYLLNNVHKIRHSQIISTGGEGKQKYLLVMQKSDYFKWFKV